MGVCKVSASGVTRHRHQDDSALTARAALTVRVQHNRQKDVLIIGILSAPGILQRWVNKIQLWTTGGFQQEEIDFRAYIHC